MIETQDPLLELRSQVRNLEHLSRAARFLLRLASAVARLAGVDFYRFVRSAKAVIEDPVMQQAVDIDAARKASSDEKRIPYEDIRKRLLA